jgi:hypothetical protein
MGFTVALKVVKEPSAQGYKYRDLGLEAGGVSNETVRCCHEF